jgi:TetR/AcrR family transcriptional repressor of mexJK operon
MRSPSKKASARPKASKPGAGRPTRDQAVQRQGELLDGALDMFLEHGYEQTTIEAIAASTNMAKRTVYARYTDKATLFRAAVQHAIENWKASDVALRELETPELDATLTAIARMRVAHVDTPQGLKLQRILNTESYRFPDIAAAAYEQTTKPVIEFLADLIERHQAKGLLRDASSKMAAIAFLSLVVSGPVRAMLSGNRQQQSEIEEQIAFGVKLFLNGLRSAPISAVKAKPRRA